MAKFDGTSFIEYLKTIHKKMQILIQKFEQFWDFGFDAEIMVPDKNYMSYLKSTSCIFN